MTKREELLSSAYEILIDFEEIMMKEFPKYRNSPRYQNLMQTILGLRHDNLKECPRFYGCYGIGEELPTDLNAKTCKLGDEIIRYLQDKAA